MTRTWGAPAKPVIDVRDAFCVHDVGNGAVAALRGLSLTVAKGERLVVHGPNGSGKTTLLRLLIGEHRLAAGDALVAGRKVGTMHDVGLAEWRATSIGWVDQFPARTLRQELNVVDNVALQLRIVGAAVDHARQRSIDVLAELGVDHLANRDVTSLSGGEAQRVAVAAALVHRPAVVFADEPAGQLDAENADRVYRALADGVHGLGAALVLVSHDHRAASVADRVVHIRDGRTSEVWWPQTPHDGDALVVDDRGWLRLPESARSRTGTRSSVRIDIDGDAIVLRPHRADTHEADQLVGEPTTPKPAPADTELDEQSQPTTPDDLVTLADITKSHGGRTVVESVTLTVGHGTLQLIAGRSGSGKSTLLRIIAGLERPDRGTVHVVGHDLAGLDRAATADIRRQHVGIVLQEVHLSETSTVAENLDLARAVRHLRAAPDADEQLLSQLGLAHLATRQARMCSGGERQRLALARAVVSRPAVVVLDEPTSQLDEATTERVAATLRELADQGAAVIVASHDPALIRRADQVLSLDSESELSAPSSATAGSDWAQTR